MADGLLGCGGLLCGPEVGVVGVAAVVPEDLVDSAVGDFFLAADALGVDAEEYLHAVAGALGDLGWRDAAVEPEETAAWRRS
jgi:hypothetical protein